MYDVVLLTLGDGNSHDECGCGTTGTTPGAVPDHGGATAAADEASDATREVGRRADEHQGSGATAPAGEASDATVDATPDASHTAGSTPGAGSDSSGAVAGAAGTTAGAAATQAAAGAEIAGSRPPGAPECCSDNGSAGCQPATHRVPVLACAEALRAGGARVEIVTARSDSDIDAVLRRFDGPPRADGLEWPAPDGKTRLVVATATDGQLRAVVRRMVRRYAPPPSRRPADLPATRTVPDLPPVGVLPLDPARTGAGRDLAALLGLPREPAAVAAAVLDGRVRRLDLLRNDGGSVTLDGALLGGADPAGRAVRWYGRVEVDDTVLSTGDEPIVACVVANAAGYAEVSGVPLLTSADPADSRVDVAVAVPVTARTRLGRSRQRLEVRRTRGRAVSVTPRDKELRYVDDGVAGVLHHKRAWWVEAAAWAVYSA